MANDAVVAAERDDFLASLVDRVEGAITEAGAKSENVGLMLVHAAAVARTEALHGFNAGGRLSSTIADVLRSKALRKSDAIVKLARDEFACILRPVSSEGVALLAAQRVMALLGATPIEFGDKSVLPDIAVGIAIFPDHGGDAEGLLQRAKHALHTARSHRDRIWIYEAPADGPAVEMSECAARLRLALEQNTLDVHYMPQLSLSMGRLTGAEALLRWTDEVLGFVPPYIAVQAAEATGLMDRLTQWIITSAVQQCVEFNEIDANFTVSVNVSPSNLREPDLPLYIDRALRTWNVYGGNLVVEITENAMMSDPVAATEALGLLKSYGVKLSIDDFGTGYSSMHYLAQLPLDELKIDLSFVRTMLEEPVNAKIVHSLVQLAHNLGLSVVAEGVENQHIMNALALLGCDQAQGYHIGKAVPGAELVTRLRRCTI
jgi:diguanylate cyclase